MRLVITSTAPLISKEGFFFAYSPYVKELEYWTKQVDEVVFVCPVWKEDKELLHTKIDFPVTKVYELKEINMTTFKNVVIALTYSFQNCYILYKAMRSANHIHLRCPGNVGLLSSIVQILFPNKKKTVKYAGNWDPSAKQPISYRLQKWILSNTFLTKNMQILVYGEWKKSSRNIKPFFTASYSEKDKTEINSKDFNGIISFLFVGMLTQGKQPLYAIKLIEQLHKQGKNVKLTLYGEGNERKKLEEYADKNKLENLVFFKGNQSQENIKQAYLSHHFVILPSLSEGWPKVVAEGMFWGCLPIVTPVSCVPNMLNDGERGILLSMDLFKDIAQIDELLEDISLYQSKVLQAVSWSRNYTLDVFESEINKLLYS